MGRILTRVVMWAIIVAMVWCLAREQPFEPDARQRDAMLDAARQYQQEQARIRNRTGDTPPPAAVRD